jgi:deoxyribose-phosphate aldolase
MKISNKELFQFIDLTSLNNDDHTAFIATFCDRAVDLYNKDFKVAAICVFPNFVKIVHSKIVNTSIKTAVVGACFPNSQSFLETKINECKIAVEKGADEVDIVINLGALKSGEYDLVSNEIKSIKKAIHPAKLKVILETGQLDAETIKKASELSIEAGADFLKTSTGKIDIGAKPEAVEIMARCILAHRNKSGKVIGLKVSGGVRTKEDALLYYNLVEEILGEKFMNPATFRIGASSLIKDLLD